MKEFEVTFVLPPDNREITVLVSDDLTPKDLVNRLLDAKQINPSPFGYLLAEKGGDFLNDDASLKDLNLGSGTVIRVIPATDAGGRQATPC